MTIDVAIAIAEQNQIIGDLAGYIPLTPEIAGIRPPSSLSLPSIGSFVAFASVTDVIVVVYIGSKKAASDVDGTGEGSDFILLAVDLHAAPHIPLDR